MSEPLSVRSQAGQAMIVIALAMIGMLAFLGLVVDMGWGYYQHRNAQNAADAAALAAVQEIGNSNTSCADATLTSSIDALVTTYTQDNTANQGSGSWNYTDNTGNSVASNHACTATGIEVTTTVSYNTFFLAIVGIRSGTTMARAGARVRTLLTYTGGPPFLACGRSMVRSSDKTNIDILDSSTSPPSLKEEYIGTTFDIHDEQLGQHGGDCGAGNGFKGNAAEAACAPLPCDFGYQNGTRAGPTNVRVAGAIPGCDVTSASDANLDNCVLIIPVADGVGGTSSTLHAVTYAAFVIQRANANTHTGTLIGAAYTQGDSTDWSPGTTVPLVLSLTE